jgi:AcrR family transcriptional regulator
MEPVDLLERCYPGRRAESKRQILRCALALFNEQGVEATTIDIIRERSDMSVGAIYHHFGSKEGVAAALFMAALDDQTRLRDAYLAEAESVRGWVQALVFSYVDWVDQQPEWARFQYQARRAVIQGGFNEPLQEANRERNTQLKAWFSEPGNRAAFRQLPLELLLSLIIGPAESYCRAWLSERVRHSPAFYRQELAEAAWRAVGLDDRIELGVSC